MRLPAGAGRVSAVRRPISDGKRRGITESGVAILICGAKWLGRRSNRLSGRDQKRNYFWRSSTNSLRIDSLLWLSAVISRWSKRRSRRLSRCKGVGFRALDRAGDFGVDLGMRAERIAIKSEEFAQPPGGDFGLGSKPIGRHGARRAKE